MTQQLRACSALVEDPAPTWWLITNYHSSLGDPVPCSDLYRHQNTCDVICACKTFIPLKLKKKLKCGVVAWELYFQMGHLQKDPLKK